MLYNTKVDRDSIRQEFTVFLIRNNSNLSKFCRKFDYEYTMVYERLNRNSISHEFVEEMVHKIDKKMFLQRINQKLVIGRKLY